MAASNEDEEEEKRLLSLLNLDTLFLADYDEDTYMKIDEVEICYYSLFWLCSVHDDIYRTTCSELINEKNDNPLWTIAFQQYPKNEDNICGGKNYSCYTMFVGYRSYSDDGDILEDTTDNFNFEGRGLGYLREVLEDCDELMDQDEYCNIKPVKCVRYTN
jgi:hypothetical protein